MTESRKLGSIRKSFNDSNDPAGMRIPKKFELTFGEKFHISFKIWKKKVLNKMILNKLWIKKLMEKLKTMLTRAMLE